MKLLLNYCSGLITGFSICGLAVTMFALANEHEKNQILADRYRARDYDGYEFHGRRHT